MAREMIADEAKELVRQTLGCDLAMSAEKFDEHWLVTAHGGLQPSEPGSLYAAPGGRVLFIVDGNTRQVHPWGSGPEESAIAEYRTYGPNPPSMRPFN